MDDGFRYRARLSWRSAKMVCLKCHKSAESLWEAWLSLDMQFSTFENFSPDLKASLQSVNPVHVCQSGSRDFQFFGGFSSVRLLAESDVDEVLLCIHTKPSAELIQQIAEASLMQSFCYTLSRDEGLASYRSVLNESLVRGTKKRLFGRQDLSVARLAEMATVDEGLIWRQQKRIANDKKATYPSVFEKVKNSVGNGQD